MSHLLTNLKKDDIIFFRPEHDAPGTAAVVEILPNRQVKVRVLDTSLADKTVNYYDIERVNNRYVFNRLHSTYGAIPEIDFIVEVANKQQQEGKVPDEDILRMCMEFIARKAQSYRVRTIVLLHGQIMKAVDELVNMGELHDVFNVGQTLMTVSVESAPKLELRKDNTQRTFEETMLAYSKIQLRLAKMSMDELRKVLTPEAQADIMSELDVNNDPKGEGYDFRE